MSIDLITQVRRRMDVSHGELLVAVELADAANDFGEGISVGVGRLADRSRQDPRTVQRQLKRLRDVNWLVLVEDGGMRGGRGKPTHYRINPAWIKGDILPGFPDFVPQHYQREKGDRLTPIACEQPVNESGERVTKTGERVTNEPLKGDTAVSPDPYTHIPSGARAGAGEPYGPAPGAQDPKPEPGKPAPRAKLPPPPPVFDERASRQTWFNAVHSVIVGGAVAERIAVYGTHDFSALPHYAREILKPVFDELVADAIDAERAAFPHFDTRRRRDVEERIEARVRRELKPMRPQTIAERTSAQVAA